MRSPCTASKTSPRSPQLQKAHAQQRRPNTAKNKIIKKKLIYILKKPCNQNIYSSMISKKKKQIEDTYCKVQVLNLWHLFWGDHQGDQLSYFAWN